MKPTTRNQRRQLKKDNKKYTHKFVAVPKDQWPLLMSDKRFLVLRNKNFLVQLYNEENDVIRLSINRTIVLPDGNWDENISWDELQDIKREIGYSHKMAIEIFPPDIDVVNVANMRHLWILDQPLPIGWKNR